VLDFSLETLRVSISLTSSRMSSGLTSCNN
jgi:hypothetical protein